MENVVDITPENAFSFSKIYPRGEVNPDGSVNYAFNLTFNDQVKGYQFATEKGAIRGRAKMIKKMKEDNQKVFFE